MYYDFFGFREPPFSIAPDPRYLYLSDRHKEALAHLMYGVQGQGGFIVITGEVGTGKTTVCRCFIDNAPGHVDIALVLNPRLSARELLSAVCDELGIPHQPDASIKVLVDGINESLLAAHAAGRHKVLIIDEAQNLSADVLEQLRLLTNLETSEKKLLQIVLLGQPELKQILALPELRQLNQRVTARYHLDAIDRDELPAYLQYRLGVAGMRGEVFTPGAVRRLYRASHGIPRLINLISDRALLGAYAEGEHLVSAVFVKQAAKEVGHQSLAASPVKTAPLTGNGWIVAALVALAVLGTVWLFSPEIGQNNAEVVARNDSVAFAGLVEREPSGSDAESLPVQDGAEGDELVAEPAPEPEPEPAPMFRFGQHTQSLAGAFEQLFGLWQVEFQRSGNPIACDYATSVGLSCLERQGSRRSLEAINRPAILELRNSEGQTGYAVLAGMQQGEALLMTGLGNLSVPFSAIEPFWYGDFRVLWRLPEYQTGEGLYGDSSGEQLWLGARMMALADQLSVSGQEAERVKRLEMTEQVRWYQRQRGLVVDGIPGAMTIIQINNDLAADIPKLRPAVAKGDG
ncbi:peptidoglycan-binding protein [Marinobacter fuscus]|uniref:Peptidoglycan-binding protein n=1 Tax=Marinobacter fuscus TaxID=2109942 RepID=A0A2T1K3U4_9GAMM|nr:ExeA family protein [Marinobacter fuscus]PSF04819.1 peptidoglycan-binding protein [Marinobacter fuscus]